ncbi:MAG TPA: hypothetical protein VN408_30200 [Actinoplanes sp.]|nr:hypothetical protein [Actinoplanes sp.]
MTSGEEVTPMDRRTADSLLRGDRTGHALDLVLAAAQAPATAGELAGEADVMAAFRAAAHAPAAHRKRPSALHSCLTRMLTLKVAAVAFATSATVGGVALAANNGALHDTTASAPEASAAAVVSRQSPAVAGPKTTTVPPRPAAPTSPPPASPSPAPSAPHRMPDLCADFQRNDQRFGEQVKRSGKNRTEVERFCRSKAGSPNKAPSSRPTRERKPSSDRPQQQWPGGGEPMNSSAGQRR